MTNWIPMRWPGGQRASTPAARQPWLNPESLRILDATPINCLVVDWAAGTADDAAEHSALAPLIAAARQRNVAVVGSVAAADVAAAKSAGLSAVIAPLSTSDPGFPILPISEQETLSWSSHSPISVVSKCVWPSITRPGGDDNLSSGPTQAPWIASNGWFTQLGRACNPAMQLWLDFEPPAKPNVVTAAAYSAAILDSENQGAHWIISLDDSLRDGLITGTPDALNCWRQMAQTLAFFQKHSDWHSYSAAGAIGILSDFAGPNQYLAFELLNLTSRRQIPYRVLVAGSKALPSFDGLKAIVSLDEGPPPPSLKARLDAFIHQGGLVMAGAKWPLEGQTIPDFTHPRFNVRRLGKGRLAVCKEDAPDPYMVAIDTQNLASRANDVMRFFNTSSVVANLRSSNGGVRALLQMVMHAHSRRSFPPVVWFQKPYRSAALWRIGQDAPTKLALQPEMGGVSVLIPEAAPYLAIDLQS